MIKSAINSTKIKDQILGVLHKSNKPLSTSEIAYKLGKSWHTIVRNCLYLELERKISKFNMGRMSAWHINRKGMENKKR